MPDTIAQVPCEEYPINTLLDVIGLLIFLLTVFIQFVQCSLAFLFGNLAKETVEDLGNENCCSICFEPMSTSQDLFEQQSLVGHLPKSEGLFYFDAAPKELLSCHIFHEKCLDRYFMTGCEAYTMRCPLCRVDLYDFRFSCGSCLEDIGINVSNVTLDDFLCDFDFAMRESIAEQYFIYLLCSKNTASLLKNANFLFNSTPFFVKHEELIFDVFSFDDAFEVMDAESVRHFTEPLKNLFARSLFLRDQIGFLVVILKFSNWSVKKIESFFQDLIFYLLSHTAVITEAKMRILAEIVRHDWILAQKHRLLNTGIKNRKFEFLVKLVEFYELPFDSNAASTIKKAILNETEESIISQKEHILKLYKYSALENDNINSHLLIILLKRKFYQEALDFFASHENYSGTLASFKASMDEMLRSDSPEIQEVHATISCQLHRKTFKKHNILNCIIC